MNRIRHNKYLITDERSCSEEQLKELFESVGWLSANYADRMVEAFRHSTVITAWEDDHLIGLVDAIDDGSLIAYIHYLLIHKDYQKMGLGKDLIACLREKYQDYLYVIVICEEKKNITFYEKLGFEVAEGATPLQILTL